MAPGISQTYAVSMTKQVCVEEGLVSDHYMSALNRGKGPDVKEDEDDPYNEGILVHYTETCESVWSTPAVRKPAWMETYNMEMYGKAKALLTEIKSRRNDSIKANGHSSEGCEGLNWKDTQWCENFKDIVWEVFKCTDLLKGYSTWTTRNNFPGMLWPYRTWPEYETPDQHEHPLRKWTKGHDTAGTKVPSDIRLAYPGPKDQRPRGAFLTALKDDKGEYSATQWKRLVDVASANWARGGRNDDSMLSPVKCTRYQQIIYHNSRETLTVVVINAGKLSANNITSVAISQCQSGSHSQHMIMMIGPTQMWNRS